jgi:flagellar hook-associated protein 1 FlgK
MAVGSILTNALSALQTNQAALQTTSANIANVNTPGYQRRVVIQESLQFGSTSGGVGIAEVRRIAATFLARESLEVTSAAARHAAENRIHSNLQAFFGRPDQNSSLSGRVDSLLNAVADLSFDVTSTERRSTLLNEFENLTSSFGALSENIQQIRFDVDQEIDASVTAINQLLAKLHEINPQIQKALASGGDAAGLKDQRDAAVRELAELMDISTQEKANGKLYVSTVDGVLLINENLFEVQYNAAGPVSGATIFDTITVHLVEPATGAASPVGFPLEQHIDGGELRGLLNMRNIELPALAKEVGELAAHVIDEINAAHNENASYPAANSLIGRNTGILSNDAHGFTGQSTFAITDPAGALVTRVDVDFTAGTYSVDGGGAVAFGGATVGDMVAAINTGLGANGSLSFSGGVMTLDAANPANGVSVVQDATTPSARGGRGFAHFFGLNDVLQASMPSQFETGLVAADGHGFTPGQSLNLVLRGPNGETAIDFTYTMAAGTVGDIINDLNAAGTGLGGFVTFSLDANGKITATSTNSFAKYKIEVKQDNTDRGGTGVPFTTLFGVGDHTQTDQARNMALRSSVKGNPQALALGKLDITGATVVGDIVLTESDNRGAIALQGLQDKTIGFSRAGGLEAMTTTLGNYASTVLADAGNRAALSESMAQSNEQLRVEINSRIESVQAVNLDEELANMMLYQQSYNAAARLISASEEIFDALLRAV